MAPQQYTALIADLDDSRRLTSAERSQVHSLMRELVEQLQRLLAFGVVSGPELVAGDRIQILFGRPSIEFSCGAPEQGRFAADAVTEAVLGIAARAARFEAVPIHFSFGLGFGPLATPIDHERIGRMDGPCFHRAERALSRYAKKEKILLMASGFGQPRPGAKLADEDLHLSGIYSAIGAIVQGWTPRQAELVLATYPHGFVAADADRFEMERGRSRTDVAREFGVGLPTVSKSIAAAQLRSLIHAAFASSWALGKTCDSWLAPESR